ncbi:hypothetical protein MRX96_035726 [Rhipicephalus microplus]
MRNRPKSNCGASWQEVSRPGQRKRERLASSAFSQPRTRPCEETQPTPADMKSARRGADSWSHAFGPPHRVTWLWHPGHLAVPPCERVMRPCMEPEPAGNTIITRTTGTSLRVVVQRARESATQAATFNCSCVCQHAGAGPVCKSNCVRLLEKRQ